MNSKAVIAFLVTVLVFLWLPETVMSQSFSVVIEKLNDLEARLDKLESTQKMDVRELKGQLKEVSEDVVQSDDSESSVDALWVEVDGLKEANEKTAEAGELTTGLRALVSEFREAITGSVDSEDESIPLEITGFGDIYSAFRQENGGNNDFEIGQVEVDLETNVDEKIIIGAAVAFDPESETFGLGAFTVDIHLFDTDGGHFRPVSGIDHSGIIVGQFDVPFGIDWHVYPSIDRMLVSAPLVVETTHDGWNDYGVQGYAEGGWYNAVVYGSNGFGYQTAFDSVGTFLGYNEWGYDPEDPTLDIQDLEMKVSFGGRVGIIPNEAIEIGGSYGGFMNQDDEMDMALMGVDLQLNHEKFSLKGEYIAHQLGIAGDSTLTNSGYYAQGTYDTGKYFFVARYGTFIPDLDGVDDLTRLSLGVGWRVMEGTEVRMEYQDNSEENSDVTIVQMVVGF
ncbi:MAG: hypothetical protein V3W18_10965 [candidate division Zixibacteria bacterium]